MLAPDLFTLPNTTFADFIIFTEIHEKMTTGILEDDETHDEENHK